MDLPTRRRFFMKRHSIPLHWQLALICSALGAVLVLAVFTLTERLVTAHFEAVAEAQADDMARTFSDLMSRTIERRATELQLVSRSVALTDLSKPEAMRAELQRLAKIAPVYGVIAVTDARGKVLAATSAAASAATSVATLPESIADWPLFTPATRALALSDTRRITINSATDSNASSATPQRFGLDVGLPLLDAAGRMQGLLFAELDLDWFRRRRDEVLAHVGNETLLSVAVFARDGRPLIEDRASLNTQAVRAFAARAPSEPSGRFSFGPAGRPALVAQAELRGGAGTAALGWRVLVVQDLEASLRPVLRMQRMVVLVGTALALAFSLLVYFLTRRVVRPYADLLSAVQLRFRADERAHPAGLTRYLDTVSAELKTGAAPVLPRGLPQARIGEQQPLEVVDMLALIAEDASRLQQLLDVLPVGVVVFDGEQRVMYWNRQCELIFGRSAEEVVGRAPWDGLMTELTSAEVAQMIERVNVQHKTYTVLRSHSLSDGSSRQCQWTVVPEFDAAGCLVRTLALVQDVTEQRAAEASKAGFARETSALAHQLLDQEAQITSRLAQTLHDRLGQTLSALRLAFDAVDARDGDPAAWHESPMTMLIDKAVAEVREALVELRPPLLDERGLYKALDNETRSLWRNPKRVRIALTSEGDATDRHDPAEVEYAAFMITREAIGNALRHASPHHIGVHLNGHAGGLTVEIKDDGCGFERDRVMPRPGHLGLVGMRERALAVGAVVSVQSLPGVGSCVRFEWAAASVQDGLSEPSAPTAHNAPNFSMEDRPGEVSPAVSYLALDRALPAANEGGS